MDIYLKKTISGLVPLYDSDYENLKKIKVGEEVKATITKPRIEPASKEINNLK